jgi:hypothetical protein
MNSRNARECAQMILSRDAVGQEKYGTSMDRGDLRPLQWLQHLMEEQADALQYAMRLRGQLADIVRAAYMAGHRDGGVGYCSVMGANRVLSGLIGEDE